MPGMTTIAKVNTNPATSAQSRVETRRAISISSISYHLFEFFGVNLNLHEKCTTVHYRDTAHPIMKG